jgi:hypothetical protein
MAAASEGMRKLMDLKLAGFEPVVNELSRLAGYRTG